MDIIISNSSDKPIYEQIKEQIKTKIVTGLLEVGEMLPSIRMLAKELRISVITTKRAYDDLEQEGFIETVAGKGSFIASKNKELLKEEQLHQVEQQIQKAVDLAKISHITKEEIIEIVTILLGG